jgi:cytochrome c biogenesis protein CcdA/thiol-disulfide isomerase/thioredoxin
LLLFLAAYLGGVLTILSPCILPVLPFTFARADQPFRRTGLPLLLGMVVTFALLSGAAASGGAWLIHANSFGRDAALIVFALLGLSLVVPRFATYLSRPFVRIGNALSSKTAPRSPRSLVISSFLLGIGTGLLWAPCAGPILGLILTGAAIQGASWRTSFLLFAYALGAATSLGVAVFAGNRAFQFLKGFLGIERWLRPAIGVAILAAVAMIFFGLDRGILTRLSSVQTSGFEQDLLSRFGANSKPQVAVTNKDEDDDAPSFEGATAWVNSQPLQLEQLRGKVVLVDFWTYSCINCLRTIPYIENWARKYGPSGLITVGVHTPEFAFEKDKSNVVKAVKDLGITYPVAMDNGYDIWSSFDNDYWPAHYFFDRAGKLRYKHFGEGKAEESERWIQQLLAEQSSGPVPSGLVNVEAAGVQMAASASDVHSPETYLGYERARGFAGKPTLVRDRVQLYATPRALSLNQWALAGKWIVHEEGASAATPGGVLKFQFHARDLHLVLGPATAGKTIRFRIKLNGQEPKDAHGVDTNAAGEGEVREQRLYQLIRQKGTISDKEFEIEFLDPRVAAFAFTFG